MIYSYATYDASGRIIQVQNTHECCEIDIPFPVGGGILKSEAFDHRDTSWSEFYVSSGRIFEREKMGISVSSLTVSADGSSEVKITGIPSGASMKISGVLNATAESIDDGDVVITSDKRGKLTILLSCAPQYLDWSIEIDAI